MSYRHCTVRLTPEQYVRLTDMAKREGHPPAEIIRRAVDFFFNGHKLLTESQTRHIKICEYSQVALDTIIREEHPEFHDRIVSETTRRMERLHGPR
ncbi:hypothetical protein [Sphingomonas solaris]|uniref:Ribbon-helix-helix protein, CopG family n=1 Tax=Alterirhizorhabdus solaris TaxID=2529389 RepID=A0A558RAK6_9SPHN|nr:hypothetical protein [Sphingomonas solaris]TVV76419.1 hypothetical protein FOY91_04120 [Sphingomonas solaris]